MPSIQDVADQINAKLDEINQNTAAGVAVGNGIRNDLGQLDADVNNGAALLSSGLFAIWETEKVVATTLDHHTKQNDTIICLLEHANDLLCGMTRKLTRQLELSEGLLASSRRIEGITERVHAAAAADFDRLLALNDKIIACCPPKPTPPEPCPPPCSISEFRPYHPKGQDWKPLPEPNRIG